MGFGKEVMDAVNIKGRLKRYVQIPLFMGVVFLIGSLILIKLNFALGLLSAAFSLTYAVLIYIAYRITWRKLKEEIVNFAVQENLDSQNIFFNFKPTEAQKGRVY